MEKVKARNKNLNLPVNNAMKWICGFYLVIILTYLSPDDILIPENITWEKC